MLLNADFEQEIFYLDDHRHLESRPLVAQCKIRDSALLVHCVALSYGLYTGPFHFHTVSMHEVDYLNVAATQANVGEYDNAGENGHLAISDRNVDDGL